MSKTAKRVEEFHRAFNLPVGDRPATYQLREEEKVVLNVIASDLVMAVSYARQGARVLASPSLNRMRLILEELAELVEAVRDEDLGQVLHESVDLRYVCDGLLVETGLVDVFDEGHRRVHEANMNKLGPDGKPIYDSGGKVIKGPNFKPADLSDLV